VSDLLGRRPVFADPVRYGFDAGAFMRLPADTSPRQVWANRLRRKVLHHPERYPYDPTAMRVPEPYRASCHPTAYPNWDNTPRSGRQGVVVEGSGPAKFEHAVRDLVASVQFRPPQERLLFVKSWNEWAEGNYLEPDLAHGHGFLQALSRGLGRADG